MTAKLDLVVSIIASTILLTGALAPLVWILGGWWLEAKK